MPTEDQSVIHPQPSRRWHQFSLRTLLIGTTIVGALLGVSLRWIVPSQRQRMAVRMVERTGGKIVYTDAPAGEARFVTRLRDWLPRDYFDHVVLIDLSNRPVTDADLAHVKGLAELSWLSLYNTQVTDAGLVHLQGLRRLTQLYLYNAQVSDAGLVHLRGLTALTELDLYNAKVTDTGLKELTGLTALTWLNLRNTQVTDAGLKHLKGLPSLTQVDLYNTHVTVTGVADLKSTLPNCRIFGP